MTRARVVIAILRPRSGEDLPAAYQSGEQSRFM